MSMRNVSCDGSPLDWDRPERPGGLSAPLRLPEVGHGSGWRASSCIRRWVSPWKYTTRKAI